MIIRIYLFLLYVSNVADSTFQDVGHLSYDNDGYGTRWIYFPDGDGYPHYVNLTIVEEEPLTHRLTTNADILFRLYIKGYVWIMSLLRKQESRFVSGI